MAKNRLDFQEILCSMEYGVALVAYAFTSLCGYTRENQKVKAKYI